MPFKNLFFLFFFLNFSLNAQSLDSLQKSTADSIEKIDIRDFFKSKKQEHAPKKIQIGAIPAVGYTLQTGWAVSGIVNVSFNLGKSANQLPSIINGSINYTQYNQIIVPVQASIWTKDNSFNLITDFRYIKYPSLIYGLGEKVDPNLGIETDFSGLKFHQTVMKKVAPNLFTGLGYYFDTFWNIKASDSLSTATASELKNRLNTKELASGLAFKLIYDSRENHVSATQGIYANIVYRVNPQFLGSDQSWESLILDLRKYVTFPRNSHNVLAFWNLYWLTTSKDSPPYLILPSTGWDDSYNTGRGYIQGRFRGRNMFYFETEYRYQILKNDLLRGVVFYNLQKFSGDLSSTFTTLKPGYGLGLRLKLNKITDTNVCLDYGFGQNGSRGFFINVTEVF
ncbi:BamA/TamA family outer membrane protein [Lacihabitans lacunae]|uniref:BamA/TamA family outer membrane protein n=1 Tax=Lacihabitans lacunae TaxID=1028214 RepID=A0ABV7Z242_9BACT